MPVPAHLVCICGTAKTARRGGLLTCNHCDRPCTRGNCPHCKKANVKDVTTP